MIFIPSWPRIKSSSSSSISRSTLAEYCSGVIRCTIACCVPSLRAGYVVGRISHFAVFKCQQCRCGLCMDNLYLHIASYSRNSLVWLCAFWTTQQKELDVSFFQALVLLLFNDGDTLSLAEIAKGTKIGMPQKAGQGDRLPSMHY